VRNKILLGAAIGWTILIAILCLITSGELPSIKVTGLDKAAHFTFHFIFTWLWGLYSLQRKQSNNSRSVLVVVGCSLLYGVLIEFLQETFTITRHADIRDVMANFAGALTAYLLFVFFKTTSLKNK
jgi:VanZ family protein